MEALVEDEELLLVLMGRLGPECRFPMGFQSVALDNHNLLVVELAGAQRVLLVLRQLWCRFFLECDATALGLEPKQRLASLPRPVATCEIL